MRNLVALCLLCSGVAVSDEVAPVACETIAAPLLSSQQPKAKERA